MMHDILPVYISCLTEIHPLVSYTLDPLIIQLRLYQEKEKENKKKKVKRK